MSRHSVATCRQQGVTLVGLILWLVMIGLIAMLGAKVGPAVIEYSSIKKAVASVKDKGGTVQEMRSAFDRQADIGYIDSIHGKDLNITKVGESIEINFAYQKTIPLIAPVSLLIDFSGTTASSSGKKIIE